MKISKLNIESYRHLENLNFDFTYQTGERKGQPLDKICFIGQSATGKTGLLELIYEYVINAMLLEYKDENSIFYHKVGLNGVLEFLINDDVFSLHKDFVYFKNIRYNRKEVNSFNPKYSLIPEEDKKYIYYFKSNIISERNIRLFFKNTVEIIENNHNLKNNIEFNVKYISGSDNFGILFNDNINEGLLIYSLSDILIYRKNFIQKISEFISKGYFKDNEKINPEFYQWQDENPNILIPFAEKLNPIISKLNLEVDLVNAEYAIPIKNKRTNEIIPIQNTSTGTKGLLLSFLPLFKLDTTDSIILIDEPERSLYPDMQMDLMDHYQRLAPDAQFIVATHSPFIAASFEPEERFILYFDEEGKVAVRRGTSPIGDDPNDMLYNDFGVDYINKDGKNAYKEYLDLKQQIYFEKDETKKEKLLGKAEKLGDLYNF